MGMCIGQENFWCFECVAHDCDHSGLKLLLDIVGVPDQRAEHVSRNVLDRYVEGLKC